MSHSPVKNHPIPRRGWRPGRFVFASSWILCTLSLGAMVTGLLPAPWPAPTAMILLLGSIFAVGVLSQRCGFFARPIHRIDGCAGRVALTFDDGPDGEFTSKILDILGSRGHRATFFVIADRVMKHPDVARQIVSEGHELGNHSFSHPWHLAFWSPRKVARELRRASAVIEEVTGKLPGLFRPPAAVLSPRIAAGACQAELELIGHTVRAGDGSQLVSAHRALGRLRRGLREGAILILHDATASGRPPVSLEVLPRLLDEMDQRGLRSVPVGELLKLND